MHITILWWSGRMWQILIRQALSYHRTVTALVRRIWSLDTLLSESDGLLHEIIWDATDPNNIQQAIRDSDAIIHVVSVPLFHRQPTHLYSRTTKAIIDAVWDKKIPYIVMSSTGTHHIRQHMPRGIRHLYTYLLGDVADDKEYEEQLLENSTLQWTIIKSPFLTPGWIQKTIVTPFELYKSWTLDMISRNTVASVIIDTIIHHKYIRQKIVPTVV